MPLGRNRTTFCVAGIEAFEVVVGLVLEGHGMMAVWNTECSKIYSPKYNPKGEIIRC